jgi:hypothetical protein
MRTASKLWLVAALALAAMALAAGPAFATTITPPGDAIGVAGPNNLDNGAISFTCQSSVIIVNFAEDGATSIKSLTFADCTEDISQAQCTFVVDGLPQAATTTYVSANVGELAFDGPPFLGWDIDCGTLRCRASADERLRGSLLGGSEVTGSAPQLVIADQPIRVSGDPGCGVGLDANWNITWTFTGTGGPGDGTYPSTSLTIAP